MIMAKKEIVNTKDDTEEVELKLDPSIQIPDHIKRNGDFGGFHANLDFTSFVDDKTVPEIAMVVSKLSADGILKLKFNQEVIGPSIQDINLDSTYHDAVKEALEEK